MSATGPNELGCYPHDGECLVHEQALLCAAGCPGGNHDVAHDAGDLLHCGGDGALITFCCRRCQKTQALVEQCYGGICHDCAGCAIP